MTGNNDSFVGPTLNLQPEHFNGGLFDDVNWNQVAQTALGFAGPVGAILNPILQMLTNQKNRQWQSEQAELQNQRNIEQWNRENEYNLPANQMQRYIDAGLNPNLIYGQPSLSADSPNMVAPFETPNAIAPQLDAGALNQASALSHQNKLTDTEIKNLLSDTPYSKANLDEKVAQVKALLQQINTNRLPELISLFKQEVFDDGRTYNDVLIIDGESVGSTTYTYKEMVQGAFQSELNFSWDQLDFLCYDLLAQLGEVPFPKGSPAYNRYYLLQQKVDLNDEEIKRAREFNKFCGMLYQGNATEASAIGSLKKLEAGFYDDIGLPPSVVDTGVGAFSGFLKAILKRGKGAKLLKKTRKSNRSGFEDVFEYN